MKNLVWITALLLTITALQAQVPGYIPKNGLVTFLPFEGNAEDASEANTRFENYGVDYDTIPGNSGIKTIAARFRGTDKSATYLLAKDVQRFMTEQFSFSAKIMWLQARPQGSSKMYQGIVCLGAKNWTWGPAYHMYLDGADNSILSYGQWTEDPTGRGEVHSQSGAIALNKWQNVIVTYDGNIMRVYLDGKLIGTDSAGINYDHHDRFILGGLADNPDGRIMGGFIGLMDDFAFWNRALTNDEIIRIQNEVSEVQCANPREIATVTLDSQKETTWKSPVLKKGVSYQVKASGVWTPNLGYSRADCEYEFYEPCTLRGKSGGVRMGMDSASAMSDARKLKPIETTINCNSHRYTYNVLGEGKPMYVLFRDSEYRDNSGTITVVVSECSNCNLDVTSDSILGYRKVETHQVVTYALRNRPELSYKWTATGGYLLGPTTNHFCDVIWGYDKAGSVCCIVSDSTCSETLCVQTMITEKNTVNVDDITDAPSLVVRPNPVSDVLQIDSRADIVGSTYDLIDVTGRRVLQAQGPSAQLSLVAIAEGVYHVVHRDAAGTMIGMQRVVVRR